jgi:hypothetical protein
VPERSIRPLTAAETRRFTAELNDRCWPGGSDRTVPAALDWLRRWGPGGARPLPLACGCAHGRCDVCN